MATRTALVTDASDGGDLEAAQAMRRENRLPSLINTAGHLCWLVAYLLRWIFHKGDEWLIYIRWRLRTKADYYDTSISESLFKQLVRESDPRFLETQELLMHVAIQCLKYYNARHQGFEYVLASEKVMDNSGTNLAGEVWTHGNFVARQRKAWCFSYLYGPPTLFFFELNGSPCHGGIVTCAPLDEPVNETYRFLGFPIWWAKCRSGKYDCVCVTCGSRHSGEGRCPEKYPCGHRRVKCLCRMCFDRSEVMHPSPTEFEHGHQRDTMFTFFCAIA